jgi:DNA polymerase III epsilon subunit-like protein
MELCYKNLQEIFPDEKIDFNKPHEWLLDRDLNPMILTAFCENKRLAIDYYSPSRYVTENALETYRKDCLKLCKCLRRAISYVSINCNKSLSQALEPKNRIIVFDTETTGLPLDNDDVTTYPHLVSICWSVYENFQHVKRECYIIKPDGWSIDNSSIHGITEENARVNGLPLIDVLNKFNEDLKKSKRIIAHNIQFDVLTLQKASFDCKILLNWPLEWLDTCYNYTSLKKLYLCTFSIEMKNAHNCEMDVINLEEIIKTRLLSCLT